MVSLISPPAHAQAFPTDRSSGAVRLRLGLRSCGAVRWRTVEAVGWGCCSFEGLAGCQVIGTVGAVEGVGL